MSKDYSNLEGLISNVKESIRNSYDKGYKQGFNEGFNDGKAQGRNEGLFEAWECVKKIFNMDFKTRREILGVDAANDTLVDIANAFSAADVIAKIKEYEEKKKQADDEVKVWDEVESIYGTNIGKKYIVTQIISKSYASVVAHNGEVGFINPTNYKKTGRTFPQIAELLGQLKEGQDETK
jgi:hypothetical protein